MRTPLLTTLLAFSFSAANAAMDVQLRSAAPVEPKIGRCHMNNCSWFDVIEKKFVKRQHSATLFNVTIRFGNSEHLKDYTYPEWYSPDLEIDWDDEEHESFVLCSPELPTWTGDGGTIVVNLLDVSGVMESSANVYAAVCHDADSYAWISNDFLTTHGYGEPIVEDVDIESPLDLFGYLRPREALMRIDESDLSDQIVGKCLLEVGGKRYIDGSCPIGIEADGSFTVGVSDDHQSPYFAYVIVEAPGVAIGHWNEEEGASHAHTLLGELTRDGACWTNADARVCAWR